MNLQFLRWHYMSLEGRIGRKKYWLMYVLPCIALGIFWEFFLKDQLLHMLATLPLICAIMCGYVKRQHDLGRSGWWILIGIIPLIGFFYNLVYLGCFRGNDEVNKYGEPVVPLKEEENAKA